MCCQRAAAGCTSHVQIMITSRKLDFGEGIGLVYLLLGMLDIVC